MRFKIYFYSLFFFFEDFQTKWWCWNRLTDVIRVHLTSKQEERLVSVQYSIKVPERLPPCTCLRPIVLILLWNSYLYGLIWSVSKFLITQAHQHRNLAILYLTILIFVTFPLFELLVWILIISRLSSKNSIIHFFTLSLQKLHNLGSWSLFFQWLASFNWLSCIFIKRLGKILYLIIFW